MIKKYEYVKVRSFDEAVNLLLSYGEKAKLIAGGTDVMIGIKRGKIAPEVLISIKNVYEGSYIKASEEGIKIGAVTTHRELEKNPHIQKIGALIDGVRQLGSVQIRNVATIGGNICNAAPSADTVPPLLVHDAHVTIKGSNGIRVLPLKDFFFGPGKTALAPGEVLTEIFIPSFPITSASAYWKHSRRKGMDLAIIGVAMWIHVAFEDVGLLKAVRNEGFEEQFKALEHSGVYCNDVRLALGVAAPRPIRAHKAEEFLKGKRLSKEILLEFGSIASSEACPRDTFRGEAWYRREMIRVLPARLCLFCIYRILDALGLGVET